MKISLERLKLQGHIHLSELLPPLFLLSFLIFMPTSPSIAQVSPQRKATTDMSWMDEIFELELFEGNSSQRLMREEWRSQQGYLAFCNRYFPEVRMDLVKAKIETYLGREGPIFDQIQNNWATFIGTPEEYQKLLNRIDKWRGKQRRTQTKLFETPLLFRDFAERYFRGRPLHELYAQVKVVLQGKDREDFPKFIYPFKGSVEDFDIEIERFYMDLSSSLDEHQNDLQIRQIHPKWSSSLGMWNYWQQFHKEKTLAEFLELIYSLIPHWDRDNLNYYWGLYLLKDLELTPQEFKRELDRLYHLNWKDQSGEITWENPARFFKYAKKHHPELPLKKSYTLALLGLSPKDRKAQIRYFHLRFPLTPLEFERVFKRLYETDACLSLSCPKKRWHDLTDLKSIAKGLFPEREASDAYQITLSALLPRERERVNQLECVERIATYIR